MIPWPFEWDTLYPTDTTDLSAIFLGVIHEARLSEEGYNKVNGWLKLTCGLVGDYTIHLIAAPDRIFPDITYYRRDDHFYFTTDKQVSDVRGLLDQVKQQRAQE